MINNYWICDRCGENINKPEEGYIEWLRDIHDNNLKNFHLVHHRNECLYNEKVETGKGHSVPGHHLQHFLDEDGLMRFLRILDDDKLVDPFEVIELIKRTHISGYEQARFHLEEGASEGIVDGPRNKGYYPSTSQIEDINDMFSNH